MNRIYSVVWSYAKKTYVVASEFASRKKIAVSATGLTMAALLSFALSVSPLFAEELLAHDILQAENPTLLVANVADADSNSAANQNAANQEKAASGDQDAEDKAVDDKTIELRQNEMALAALGIIAPTDESVLEAPSVMLNRDSLLRYAEGGGTATGADAIAIGNGSKADGANSVALGAGSQALADNSYALGGASVSGANTFVYGKQVGSVTFENGLLMGQGNSGVTSNASISRTDASILFGNNNRVAANYGVQGSNDTAFIGIGHDNIIRGSGSLVFGHGNTFGTLDTVTKAGGAENNSELGPTNAMIIGNNSRVDQGAHRSLILGNNVEMVAEDAVAIGNKLSNIIGNYSVTIGNNIIETGRSAVAIGDGAYAGQRSIGIGNTAWAYGEDTIVMGTGADSVGNNSKNSIALGTEAKVNNVAGAIAMGNQSFVSAANSMALGSSSKATGKTSVALGNASSATGANSVALGAGSIASEANVVAVGFDADNTRKIKWVTEGEISTTSKEAINGSQLYDTNKVIADGLMGINNEGILNSDGILKSPDFSGAFGKKEGSITNVYDGFEYLNSNINGVVNGTSGLVIIGSRDRSGSIIINEGIAGAGDIGTIDFAKDNGDTRKVTGVTDGKISSDSTDAINGSQLYGTNQSIVDSLGGGATINKDGTITGPTYKFGPKDEEGNNTGPEFTNVGDALGNLDGRVDQNTKDIAQNTKDIVDIKDGIGGNWDNGKLTLAVGDKSYNTVEDALGGVNNTVNDIKNGKDGIVKVEDNQVVLDKGITGDKDFNIAGETGDRKLTGVAKGEVSETSSDAINGSQLNKTHDSIGKLLGGGAKINADGSVYYDNNGDALTINGKGYKTVADAISQLDQNQIFKMEGDKITIGETGASAKEISFANGKGDSIKVTDVADGKIEENSKEAVNGGQLWNVEQKVDREITSINNTLNHYNTRINNIEKKVHENRKVASAGIAGAMAMSSIPYIEYSKYSFGMGIGYYDGESAISIGFQGKINDRARYRLQMSYDTQNKVGLGAGVAFEL